MPSCTMGSRSVALAAHVQIIQHDSYPTQLCAKGLNVPVENYTPPLSVTSNFHIMIQCNYFVFRDIHFYLLMCQCPQMNLFPTLNEPSFTPVICNFSPKVIFSTESNCKKILRICCLNSWHTHNNVVVIQHQMSFWTRLSMLHETCCPGGYCSN